MQNRPANFWGDPIFSYTRAQAIADGVLIDLTTATDDKGQRLCPQAGFNGNSINRRGINAGLGLMFDGFCAPC